GLGRHQEVNGNANYLHDGRAMTIEQAVLWHGGEAEQSRSSFTRLNTSDREALIAFLKSL
ncbi:MAG: di-heme oxidoredictase family protein, partial [Rhodospirillales bacterium]